MNKAVIYARYSSDNQTEQSIEGQMRVCKEYAEKNDFVIVNEYIDRAITGTNDKRPALQQMLYHSKKKGFQYVLVYKLDRFSRSRYDSAINRAVLEKNGVKLLFVTEPISDTSEGIILDSMLKGMAEYYSAELSQKVKRGGSKCQSEPAAQNLNSSGFLQPSQQAGFKCEVELGGREPEFEPYAKNGQIQLENEKIIFGNEIIRNGDEKQKIANKQIEIGKGNHKTANSQIGNSIIKTKEKAGTIQKYSNHIEFVDYLPTHEVITYRHLFAYGFYIV